MKNKFNFFDRNKSLELLEKNYWDEPVNSTSLIEECHRLRKVPINKLTVENLRIMIGQDIGLLYLIPVALEFLEENCWISGDYYEGDLLYSVVRVSSDFWEKHPEYTIFLNGLISQIKESYDFFNKEIYPEWIKNNK